MADSFTQETSHSWGGRLSGSLKGICWGLVFGVAGIAVLVWNEGNYVSQHKALAEGLKIVQDVPTTTVDAANEGKLIHIVGDAETSADVVDTMFGVTAPNALKLKRNVEMYQWVESSSSETRKNTGGSTTTKTQYSYDKQWKSQLVRSDSFRLPQGHENPTAFPYDAESFVADPITMGAFTLSQAITNKMNWYRPIGTALSVNDIPDEKLRNKAALFGSGYYFGTNPSFPDVGDTRVSFQVVPEQTISIIARQTAGSLSAYTAKNGGTVLLVEAGPHDAGEMFQHANSDLVTQTWILRAVGFFCIFLMFKLLTTPLEVFADVVPCVGDLVGTGGTLIAFVAAAAVSAVVIALAWLIYRPIISLLILGVVGGLVYFLRFRRVHNSNMRGEYIPTATAYELPAQDYDLSFTDIPTVVKV